MNSKQKNQLFSNDTCNLNDDNKSAKENTDNRLYETPTNIKNVSPKHEDFKREIVTQQSKARKDFNNKIENKQVKTGEEINELNLFQLIYLLRYLLEKLKNHAQNLNLTMTTKRSL